MIHLEQVMWPTNPNILELDNITWTEAWIFKDRFYKGLCNQTSVPVPYGAGFDGSPGYATEFRDHANTCYKLHTNGNPLMAWCYIIKLEKIKCGQLT